MVKIIRNTTAGSIYITFQTFQPVVTDSVHLSPPASNERVEPTQILGGTVANMVCHFFSYRLKFRRRSVSYFNKSDKNWCEFCQDI